MGLSPRLSTVLSALPHLSAPELKEVRSRVGALTSLAGLSGEAPPPPSGDYLLEGIVQALRRRGALGADKRIPSRVIPPGYADAAADVRSYFERHMGQLSSAELASLGQLMGEALATYLEKRGVPISPQPLLANVAKVPRAVDAAFPGYLESGLLAHTWRRQS